MRPTYGSPVNSVFHGRPVCQPILVVAASAVLGVSVKYMDHPPRIAVTSEELASEARRATEMLQGKPVKVVWRHTPAELGIEFNDGTRLFVDMRPEGLELSIT